VPNKYNLKVKIQLFVDSKKFIIYSHQGSMDQFSNYDFGGLFKLMSEAYLKWDFQRSGEIGFSLFIQKSGVFLNVFLKFF